MASISASSRPDAQMHRPPSVAPPRQKSRRWIGILAALLFVLLLRLLPGQSLLALDRGEANDTPPTTLHRANPSEMASETFPGSAYFFAQDAFAPIDPTPPQAGDPAVTALSPGSHSPHVLQIDNGPAALSMPMRGLTFLDQARALQCMTNAIYYEAGNEPEEGQRAVAQVILNRLASGRWPSSICGVIYQGTERSDRLCQFTFSCDGSMARTPAAPSWARARRIAARVLSGEVFAPAGLATFYHTLAVRPPWADRVRPVAVIGAHIFYRLPGEGGMPAAYRMRYSGREIAQPGAYAFAPPPKPTPLLTPPGPDLATGWAAPQPTTAGTTPPLSATMVPPRLPYGSQSGASTAGYPVDPGSSNLPQSTIRPEYRNSGRALH